ncbi:sensor histidine kinase [Luteolibacter luteus]|uniref:histidine kinase n=1 Tax=Luteolibacter luteus TaxID=2728835 RepID=A0A858RHY7_9BACT|nr:ATP-binding protein [Luteolibacter luteus]QJE96164.1 hypothetical protein HHL09_10330 [Luteolibacter luteus]
MSSPSIRRSLLVRCGVGVGVLLCVLSATVYLLVESSLYSETDEAIKETAALLANQVELENDAITYEWEEGLGANQTLVAGALFQFWNEKTGSTSRSPGLRWRDLPKFTGVDGAPLMRNIQLSDGHHARALGLRIYPFVLEEEVEAMKARGTLVDRKTLPQILVVARDAEPVHRALQHLRWILIGGSLLTLGLGYVLIERAVGSSLRPIYELSGQVQDRSSHRLDEPLDLPEDLPSELTGLATHFNRLLSRVAAIRQREKDFIRHAAHELRTPIAGLRATTDLALSQNRDASTYAAHLQTCQKSAVELGELVKRLSALARIGSDVAPAVLEPVELIGAIEACWEPFGLRAEARSLGIHLLLPGDPLTAVADPALLRIILNNLFDNAISYTSPRGEIWIKVVKADGRAEISVRNTTGEEPIDTERLFEPLFRRETSRHDAGSHLGVGLTLSLEAAKAMRGDLRARSEKGEIEFILSVPASDRDEG